VTFPSRLLLPWRFDVGPLVDEVAAIPDDEWVPHFNAQIHDGGWSGVPLRASVGGLTALYPDPTAEEFAPTPRLERSPALAAALDRIPAPLLSARLLRLAPGSHILPHRDHRLGYVDGEVRLHIPITSPPGAELVVDGTPVPMRPGECWYVDVNRTHSAENRSDDGRVHLVVDCVVDEAFDAVLQDVLASGPGQRAADNVVCPP
jgi:hypothetical protein